MNCFTLWAQRCHGVGSPHPPYWVSVSSLQAFDILGNLLFLILPHLCKLRTYMEKRKPMRVCVSSLSKGENSWFGSVWRYKHPHTSKSEFRSLNNISCLFSSYNNWSVWAVSCIFRREGAAVAQELKRSSTIQPRKARYRCSPFTLTVFSLN